MLKNSVHIHIARQVNQYHHENFATKNKRIVCTTYLNLLQLIRNFRRYIACFQLFTENLERPRNAFRNKWSLLLTNGVGLAATSKESSLNQNHNLVLRNVYFCNKIFHKISVTQNLENHSIIFEKPHICLYYQYLMQIFKNTFGVHLKIAQRISRGSATSEFEN